jgi:hypothetical protein
MYLELKPLLLQFLRHSCPRRYCYHRRRREEV